MQVFLLIYITLLMKTHTELSITDDVLVSELSLAVGQLLRRLRADTNPDGLTWSQTMALARLEREGAMTTAELARAETVKPQSMGATLTELEQEGLVARQAHPTDGRQVLFVLTAAGAQARRKRSAAKQKWLLNAVAALTAEERETLMAAVDLISRLGDAR